MKKWIIILIALIVLWNVFGNQDAPTDDTDFALLYDIYSCHWNNGTFYMQGTICNMSQTEDMLGLEDATLTVIDSNGLELFTVNVNRDFQQKLRLRPCSMAPYNFTAQNLKYDESEYSSLTSGLRGILNCSYHYSECDGRSCDRCHYVGLSLDENPFISDSGNNNNSTTDDTYAMKCTACRGTGICQTCKGDGKSRLKGVLAAFGCVLCDSSGDCHKCDGKGYTVHH